MQKLAGILLVFSLMTTVSFGYNTGVLSEREKQEIYGSTLEEIQVEKDFRRGTTEIAFGMVMLVAGGVTKPLQLSAGRQGNPNGVLTFNIAGALCDFASPLAMSAGATAVQGGYETYYGFDNPGSNWLLYQIGLAFTLTGNLVSLSPKTQKPLYSDTTYRSNGVSISTIRYSPAGLVLTTIGELLYLANGINAIAYLAKTRTMIKKHKSKVSINPQFFDNGAYGLRMVYLF